MRYVFEGPSDSSLLILSEIVHRPPGKYHWVKTEDYSPTTHVGSWRRI